MANVIESIRNDLADFDIVVKNQQLLAKLYDVALKCGVDSGEVANEWIAFSTENDNCSLTSDNIDKWDSKLTSSRRSKKKIDFIQDTQVARHYDETTLADLFGADDEGLINMYGTSEDKQQLNKRSADHLKSPVPANKMAARSNGYKPSLLSPTSVVQHQVPPGNVFSTPNSKFTPSMSSTPSTGSSSFPSNIPSTPAVRYSQRSNAGQVVCSLNDASLPTRWRGSGGKNRPKISHYDETTALTEPYRYMYQTIFAKSTELNDHTEKMIGLICNSHGLPDPLSLAAVSLEPAVYAGRVVSDAMDGGHMNSSSILLEGTKKVSQGRMVRLNLSQVKNYSLFPGQAIVIEGNNCSDLTLVASRVYSSAILDQPFREFSTTPAFTMMIAAGPFATSDSIDMEPLHDLITVVSSEMPDVLVLFGPFVDGDHKVIKEGQLGQSHQALFESSVQHLLQKIDPKCTQVIMLPSQRDVHHAPVYPQPPFIINNKGIKNSKDLFVSDPCTLAMNGVVMGMTSTDIIKHLSGQEAYQCEDRVSDRMARLAGHLLDQQSYYPLYPPHEDVGMDISRTLQYSRLPVKPDILFLPSELRPFVKVVNQTLCINPGRITKGEVGGTFAKLQIPAGHVHSLHTRVGVQILRI